MLSINKMFVCQQVSYRRWAMTRNGGHSARVSVGMHLLRLRMKRSNSHYRRIATYISDCRPQVLIILLKDWHR